MKNKKLLSAVIAGVMLASMTSYAAPMLVTASAVSDAVKPPAELKAEAVDESSIKLTWKKAKGAEKYRIRYTDLSTGKSYDYKDVKGTSCTVTGLKAATTYKFLVSSLDYNNGKYDETPTASEVSGKTKSGDKYAPLDNIKLDHSTDTAVKISWGVVDGAAKYRVYMYNAASKKFEKYRDLKDFTIVIRGLEPETKYYFKVAAIMPKPNTIDSFALSRKSKTLTVKTNDAPEDSWFSIPEYGTDVETALKNEGLKTTNRTTSYSDGSSRYDITDDHRVISGTYGGSVTNYDNLINGKTLFFDKDGGFFMCMRISGRGDSSLKDVLSNIRARRGTEKKSIDAGDRIIYLWKEDPGESSEFVVKFKSGLASEIVVYGVLDFGLLPEIFKKQNDRDSISVLSSLIVYPNETKF